MNPSESVEKIRVRWVIPARGPIVEGGVVHVRAGTIVAIEKGSPAEADDLGEVAILPGFVNAHTHLDLSSFEKPIPAGTHLVDWLRRVVEHRRSTPPAGPESLARGIAEIVASGATAVGDIGNPFASSIGSIDKSGLAGTAFHEVIGLRAERYEPIWREATKQAADSERVASAFSPHAPYSTAIEVYRRCGGLSSARPAMTHWLESREEREFLATAQGPIREFLEGIGAWDEGFQPTADPWSDYLGTGRWTLVHANYLTSDEIDRLATPAWRERICVVYCPRTHAHFGHEKHPFRQLLAAGIPVALGTDSRASNPDLSVFDEARFLAARASDIAPATLIEMLTLHGRRAIGAERGGDLAPGARADLTVIRPGPGAEIRAAILDSQSDVVGQMVRGRWLKRPAG